MPSRVCVACRQATEWKGDRDPGACSSCGRSFGDGILQQCAWCSGRGWKHYLDTGFWFRQSFVLHKSFLLAAGDLRRRGSAAHRLATRVPRRDRREAEMELFIFEVFASLDATRSLGDAPLSDEQVEGVRKLAAIRAFADYRCDPAEFVPRCLDRCEEYAKVAAMINLFPDALGVLATKLANHLNVSLTMEDRARVELWFVSRVQERAVQWQVVARLGPEERDRCYVCAGAGRIAVPNGGHPCVYCQGTGRNPRWSVGCEEARECQGCRGSGWAVTQT